MGQLPEGETLFYVDGHVRVYHGSQTELPRHHVAQERGLRRSRIKQPVTTVAIGQNAGSIAIFAALADVENK